MRQKFALKLLDVYESGRVIVNFDESAISTLDARHHAWFKKGGPFKKPDYTKVKQISLQAAITSEGDCFYSMHIRSNNSVTTRLFLEGLFIYLQNNSSSWKSKYVLLIDNA